jgi:hypothetical protein
MEKKRFKWKKNTFIPKNTMNTLNKEIIKPYNRELEKKFDF